MTPTVLPMEQVKFADLRPGNYSFRPRADTWTTLARDDELQCAIRFDIELSVFEPTRCDIVPSAFEPTHPQKLVVQSPPFVIPFKSCAQLQEIFADDGDTTIVRLRIVQHPDQVDQLKRNLPRQQ